MPRVMDTQSLQEDLDACKARLSRTLDLEERLVRCHQILVHEKLSPDDKLREIAELVGKIVTPDGLVRPPPAWASPSFVRVPPEKF